MIAVQLELFGLPIMRTKRERKRARSCSQLAAILQLNIHSSTLACPRSRPPDCIFQIQSGHPPSKATKKKVDKVSRLGYAGHRSSLLR